MKTLIIIIIKIFFISALFIISNQNLHMKDAGERQVFLDSYYSWVQDVFNQTVEIAGYVINSRWLPENDSQQSLKT